MTLEEQIQKLTEERDAARADLKAVGECVGGEPLAVRGLVESMDAVIKERDAAMNAAGEMRKQIDCAAMALEFWYKMPNPTPAQIDVAREALRVAVSTDCGKGYVKAESLRCFKCDDGHTPLYCLNCAREGYHDDDEWKMVAEALQQTLEHLKVMFDIDGRPLDPNDREIVENAERALAHAESLLKK